MIQNRMLENIQKTDKGKNNKKVLVITEFKIWIFLREVSDESSWAFHKLSYIIQHSFPYIMFTLFLLLEILIKTNIFISNFNFLLGRKILLTSFINDLPMRTTFANKIGS